MNDSSPTRRGDVPWQLRRTGLPVVTLKQEISAAVSRHAKRKTNNTMRWAEGGGRGGGCMSQPLTWWSQLPASIRNSAGLRKKTRLLSVAICQGEDSKISQQAFTSNVDVWKLSLIIRILHFPYKNYVEHHKAIENSIFNINMPLKISLYFLFFVFF